MTDTFCFNEFLGTQGKVIARNIRLEDVRVTDAILDGAWIGRNEAQVKQVVRRPGELSFQLLARLDYLKAVHVVLLQCGKDIKARVDWAAYTTSDHDYGYKMKPGQDNFAPVASGANADGYGVSELHYKVRDKMPVLVDASNMVQCFPSIGSRMLVYLKEALSSGDYAPTFVFDATIPYVLKKKGDLAGLELLKRLQREDPEHTILVPAGTRSDDYLLMLSDNCGYPIVTCDTFRQPEYRKKYAWLGYLAESGKKRVHAPAIILGKLLLPGLKIGWDLPRFPIGEEVSIRADINGRYLCADNGERSEIRPILANREQASDWETFSVVDNGDGTVSLRARANGKYVSAEINTDGRLNARADKIDAWEKFWLIWDADTRHYILRSDASGKFVSANPDTGLVCASADVADAWERLTLSRASGK